ncbi:MAG: outer membrane protein assembly factor BamA [Spirochaetes bacterium]|nr:outer membrane protein assembly factor BamA [Spirochaetota bacterium]
MKKTVLSILLACVIGVVFEGEKVLSQQSRYEGKIVRKVEFVGLRNLDKEDLIEKIETAEGFPLRADEIRKDIRALFKDGWLEHVKVEVEEYRDGVHVRFVCKERPIVRKVEFRGTDAVSEMDLSSVVLVKENEPLRIDNVEKSVHKIKKKYEDEGFFNAVVAYEIKEESKEENTVNVVFRIDEGEEIRVAKIAIMGARQIPEHELIDVMETDERGALGGGGQFKKDVYNQDKMKIVSYYKERGYLDAQIVDDSVEYEWENPIEKQKRVIFINIKVFEGEQYYFDRYTVSGNKVFDTKVFEELFEQRKSGEVFNYTAFQKDMQMMSQLYGSKGYIFSRIIPKKTITEREIETPEGKVVRKFVKIDFEIKEGDKVKIENIIVRGYKKTKKRVIEREIIIQPGDLFDAFRVQRSRERIFNLGFFKEVNVNVRPGSREGLVNLIFEVEEQPTGTISLGGGYGTTTGFSIFADVAENNMLGNGQRVGVRFEYGPLRKSITLSFLDPWITESLFDAQIPLGLRASIYYMLNTIPTSSMFPNSNIKAEYQRQTVGYSVGPYYRFWDFYGIGAMWNQGFKSYLNPTGNASDEVFIQEARGIQLKNTLTTYVYRDSKDNYMNPTRGMRIELSAGFTGGRIFRGDDHFIKYDGDFYFYYSPFNLPLLRTHPVVIELRANGSFIMPPFQKRKVFSQQNPDNNPWIEPEDRLRIGGPETLRGWDYFDLGFPDSWRVGLFHRVLYGAELRIPIHPQILWFAFFFDAGSLWTDRFWEQHLIASYQQTINDDRLTGEVFDIHDWRDVDIMSYFRYSWGFGFKIQIPMMPLRFWFGRKLKWVGKGEGYFEHISDFNFQFGIGDMRF